MLFNLSVCFQIALFSIIDLEARVAHREVRVAHRTSRRTDKVICRVHIAPKILMCLSITITIIDFFPSMQMPFYSSSIIDFLLVLTIFFSGWLPGG